MSSIKLTADSGGGTFEIKAPSSGSNARVLTVPDSASGTVLTTTNPKSGSVIQVVQQEKSDTASTSSATFATLITKDITRSSASNKILVSFHVMVSSGASSVPVPQFNLQRGSTNLAQPAVTSSNPATRSEYTFANSVSSISFEFLDDGAASESSLTLTYNLQWARSGTGTAYLGRYFGSVNYNAPSILILKEVAA